MRITELSRRSGVTPASIKYYTREGLLPAGERIGATQTEYGDAHVARLRLIRALLDGGGLSITATREVLTAVDDADVPLGQAFATAQHALPQQPEEPSAASVAALLTVLRERGWSVHDGNPGVRLAASTLDRYAAIGRDDLARIAPEHLEAAELIAKADLRFVAEAGSRARMAETVVVGTILGDALMAGLRRAAHEDLTTRQHPLDADDPVGPASP